MMLMIQSLMMILMIQILDLCLKRENKLIRFLRDTMLKKKIITENVYNSLYQNGSSPGVLCGLPKVHKSDCPARPILSGITRANNLSIEPNRMFTFAR